MPIRKPRAGCRSVERRRGAELGVVGVDQRDPEGAVAEEDAVVLSRQAAHDLRRRPGRRGLRPGARGVQTVDVVIDRRPQRAGRSRQAAERPAERELRASAARDGLALQLAVIAEEQPIAVRRQHAQRRDRAVQDRRHAQVGGGAER